MRLDTRNNDDACIVGRKRKREVEPDKAGPGGNLDGPRERIARLTQPMFTKVESETPRQPSAAEFQRFQPDPDDEDDGPRPELVPFRSLVQGHSRDSVGSAASTSTLASSLCSLGCLPPGLVRCAADGCFRAAEEVRGAKATHCKMHQSNKPLDSPDSANAKRSSVGRRWSVSSMCTHWRLPSPQTGKPIPFFAAMVPAVTPANQSSDFQSILLQKLLSLQGGTKAPDASSPRSLKSSSNCDLAMVAIAAMGSLDTNSTPAVTLGSLRSKSLSSDLRGPSSSLLAAAQRSAVGTLVVAAGQLDS